MKLLLAFTILLGAFPQLPAAGMKGRTWPSPHGISTR